MYAFELVTWPWHLAITGDIGDALLKVRGTEDVLPRFDSPGQVSYSYWAEKAEAGGTRDVWSFDARRVRLALLEDGMSKGDLIGLYDHSTAHETAEFLQSIGDFDPETLDIGRIVSPRFVNLCDAIAWARDEVYGPRRAEAAS